MKLLSVKTFDRGAVLLTYKAAHAQSLDTRAGKTSDETQLAESLSK
jgi:hypothetical protein